MVLFQRLLFLRANAFFLKTCFNSLLPFPTFVNYERAYLVDRFLHILCLYFDMALVQLWVITKTKKFVAIVTVCRVSLDYNLVITNKESKKQLFRIYLPVKLADGKMSIKKEKVPSYPYSYLIYKIFIWSNYRRLEKLNPP